MDIPITWGKMMAAIQTLFNGLPQNGPLDQFIRVRNTALELAGSEQMQTALSNGYTAYIGENPASNPKTANGEKSLLTRVADALVAEWDAFAIAVSVWGSDDKTGKKARRAKTSALKKLLDVAKTIIDSVSDIFSNLSEFAKGVLTLLKEALSFFS